MARLFQSGRGQFLAACAQVDLSPPQAMAMRSLTPDHPIPMSELAGLMHCDNSNVTGIADRLEDRGLVVRRPGTHDRRVKYLQVTAKGVEVQERLQALLGEPPAGLLALSAAEQRQLLALMRKATGEPAPAARLP